MYNLHALLTIRRIVPIWWGGLLAPASHLFQLVQRRHGYNRQTGNHCLSLLFARYD